MNRARPIGQIRPAVERGSGLIEDAAEHGRAARHRAQGRRVGAGGRSVQRRSGLLGPVLAQQFQ